MKRKFKMAVMMFFLIIFAALAFVFIVGGGAFDMSWWPLGGRVFFGLIVAALVFVIPSVTYCETKEYS
jgi:membrane protein YdbS with pleckstrin-like domain